MWFVDGCRWMRRCLFGLLGALGVYVASWAVPAYPGRVFYRCADGSGVYLYLKGDEQCKWAETEDGYTLLRDRSGAWCYAAVDERGETVASAWHVSAVRSGEVERFLQGVPKRIAVRKQTTSLRSAGSVWRTGGVVKGTQKTLVILMQFDDLPFTRSNRDFQALFNEAGFSEDGAQGSVRDFYRENSHGLLDLQSDVLGPFTAARPMRYYGENDRADQDSHPEELFLEAIEFASSEVSLSEYDTDGDGIINNIHIIYAGHGEEAGASSDAIWAHEMRFGTPCELAGVRITGYSCAPELRDNQGRGMSRIGVHCHEIGHSFGAMDFYDTDYEQNGEYPGTGEWDLMASGSWNNGGITPAHFNPYVKLSFGWVECETLSDERDGAVLLPAEEDNRIFRLETGTEGDYFLLENRQRMGFDAALPGSGLLVYHILPEMAERTETNRINALYPQTCYIVSANAGYAVPDGRADSYGDVDSRSCPFTSGNFTSQSVPAALAFDGTSAQMGLTQIAQEADGSILFDVTAEADGGGQEEPGDDSALLFADSFEDGELGWTVELLQGYARWETYRPRVFDLKPKPSDGAWYALLEWERMSLAPLPHVARMVSPLIKRRGNGQARLSFQFQNQRALSKSGKLRVLYREVGMKEWSVLATLSDACEEWQSSGCALPASSADFQVAFEGEMLVGLILLDDVEVHAESVTALETEVIHSALSCYGQKGRVYVENADASVPFYLYRLSGDVVYSGYLKEGVNTIEVPSGFYVAVQGKKAVKIRVD